MLLISLLPVLLLLLFRGNDHCHTYHSLFNLISTSDCETWQESALAVAWSSTYGQTIIFNQERPLQFFLVLLLINS